MNCYCCGCRLSEHDYCTGCGADVALYKKIMMVSNMYYNQGLEKANVRDLSGAIVCLRQSLKFNKNNIEARNLLGLVYFEIGEVVAALSEWVISKNLQPEKNIADSYLDMIQNNGSRLETINQTIKKYNQALVYCIQDSKDLAVIQLKKVLSLNPKFVQAHQLLALLYIDSMQWEKAKKELAKCRKIDTNNTLTLRYEQEIERSLDSEETGKTSGKNKDDEIIRYQADNELIIQPLNLKESKNSNASTIINILIGLVIGIAAMFFLVVPGVVSREKSQSQEQLAKLGNQLDVKTNKITELEKQIDEITLDNETLHAQLDGFVGEDGTLRNMDGLLIAARSYIDQTATVEETAEYLKEISTTLNLENTSQSFQDLYQVLFDSIGPTMSDGYYATGYKAYRDKNYGEAIDAFKLAFYYNPSNEDALYNLANAYRKNGDAEEAIATYEQVLQLVAPGTDKARKAEQYKNSLKPVY